MWRKKPRAVLVWSLTAIALGASACGGGQPAARGFDSTELVPTRDSTIQLWSEDSPGILQYRTDNSSVYWTLNLVTGAVQSYGTTMPPSASPSGTLSSQPYSCIDNYVGDASGSFTLKIVDTATNAETDIGGVLGYTTCPGADRMLTAMVVDADGSLVLETGPFDQLMPVQLSVVVLGFVGWGGYTMDAMGLWHPTNMAVLTAPPDAPDEEEIDTVELATLAVTVAVPAVPASVAWTTGATPVGSLQSTTVEGSTSLITSLSGHYIYPRKMSDGGSTMFAGPFASGPASELALFELPAGMPIPSGSEVDFLTNRPQALTKTVLTWQLDGGSGGASQLVAWDDTDLVLTTCPSVPGANLAGTWSPDDSKVLFSLPPSYSSESYGPGSLLDLLSLGAAGQTSSCQQLAGSAVVNAAFSPDGDFIFWLEQPPNEETQLFTAASDGSGAQMVGKGEIQNAHFIADGGARLELTLGGELEWMDLHDPTGTLHHVAERVSGLTYDVPGAGGQWLIMLYQWSTTDNSGTLALINRESGQVHLISPSVTQFEVLQEELGADGGLVPDGDDAGVTVELLVVYVVRGRNPSPQDGIWRATVTPSELQ